MMNKINPDTAKLLVLLAALIAVAVTFGVYIPSLGNGFVNWDDDTYVLNNIYIQGFSAENLGVIFFKVFFSNYAPLHLLSYSLDFAIWGLDPFGFHLTNSILHAANTFLVALLAARLADTRGCFETKGLFVMALASGLLFGLHPLHVESVAWVTERKDVLNALFFLFGLHAYLSYLKGPSRRAYYILTLFFFTLSLLSKAMTVTMPLVLLMIDLYPLGRLKTEGLKRLIIEKLPFFGLSLLIALISIWSQSGALAPIEKLPLDDRLHVAARGALFYIYKSLVPLGLAPLYPRDFAMGFNLWFAAYTIVLASITALAVLALKRTGAPLSAWGYYLVTLLPVIGIMQAGRQAAADRYTYIPSIGLVILVAAGAAYLVQKKKAFVPVLAAITLLSALLSFLTVRQTGVWKDSAALWTREIKVFPEYPNGHVGRGLTYVFAGDFNGAVADLDKGIGLKPGSNLLYEAYFYRGIALSSLGRIQEGLSDFTAAINLKPDEKIPYRNRGNAYMRAGEPDLAIRDLKQAADLPPVDGGAFIDLGLAYMRTGDRENAYESMERALALGDKGALPYLKELEGARQN